MSQVKIGRKISVGSTLRVTIDRRVDGGLMAFGAVPVTGAVRTRRFEQMKFFIPQDDAQDAEPQETWEAKVTEVNGLCHCRLTWMVRTEDRLKATRRRQLVTA